MKITIALLFIGVAVVAAIQIHKDVSYATYCKNHNKVITEEGMQIFNENVQKIRKHNSNPRRSYDMGLNQFTDMSESQIKAWKGAYSDTRFDDTPVIADTDLPQAPPDSWDWRQKGAVNPIKNQEACGVCWAFASTGAVESAYFIDQKHLVSLSESQQADCDTSGGCNECAFKWLQSNKPCTESSYPYQCPDSRGCKACSAGAPPIHSFAVVQQSNETALKAAVFDRPVAIGIAASGDFMNYKSGVFDGTCPGGRDHAVVLVGYGSDNGADYWILRNSWGTGWGEAGYMRISRGKNGPDGICLLATDPSVPYFNK